MVGRIPVMNVTPVVDPAVHRGDLPAKATVGEPFPVTASVFREGHDKLGAEVVATDPSGDRRPPVPMVKHGNVPDRYDAWITPDQPGRWTFEVQSWSDPIGTWQHAAGLKIPAGVDVDLMFTEGQLLFERVLKGLDRKEKKGPAADVLKAAVSAAKDAKRPVEARLAALQAPELAAVLAAHPIRDLLTVVGPYAVFADRPRALYGSWYEFFPRSEGATVDAATGAVTSGTLRTAAERLDAVAEMGFDVIYLPPIHPIGEVNRKGPNNTLTPGPSDTGSPWAIGSKDGGHDAIHPDLGDFDDFDAFVARATELGLEVALDLALQAAPDHPWATKHQEWFTTRADGTIAYAENPPKKYQDIYPLNFDNDYEGLYAEVLRIVRLWMDHGVRIFRVDNPHTKPVAFWEQLLGEIRESDPDVLFLAEAFTRPAMMQGLGAVGFHQSYTYFTWRTAKWEIEQLPRRAVARHRPPDAAELLRQHPRHPPCVLAVRRSARVQDPGGAGGAWAPRRWGVYAGYELFEHVAVKPGSEEYLDSEKYQIRVRDWAAAEASGHTLAPYLTELNRIRREHPALRLLRNVTIHRSDDDHTLVFSKSHDLGHRRAGRHGHRRAQPRPARHPRDHGAPRHARARLRLARLVRRRGRAQRRQVHLGRAQLRPARPLPRARAHPGRAEGCMSEPDGPHRPDPTTNPFSTTSPPQPDWFKTAVFYEVLVRSFRDADGNGTGDFKGLIEKLDYLHWLGVDCLWVPPFFSSPLRDGGYDVADYTNILPEIGTTEDFHAFLDEAHKRDIKVIIDFVMNHTSDAHPWFQASRSDPDGPYGDFYVWSDTDDLYQDARSSSWTPSRRTGPGTRSASSTTGTGSSPTSRTSTSTTRRSWRRCWRRCPSGWTWAWTASGSTRCPTSTSAPAPTARTSPRPTRRCATSDGSWTRTTPGGCCWPRPTSGPATSWTTSATSRRGATSATCASTSR